MEILKSVVTICMLVASWLSCGATPFEVTVTLDDIRNYDFDKSEEWPGLVMDPFADDGKLLKSLDLALKLAGEIKSPSNRMVIEGALRDAMEDLRQRIEVASEIAWKGSFGREDGKKRLGAQEAQKEWSDSPWRRIKQTYKGGRPFDWSKVSEVSPQGVKVLEEGGFKWISFKDLSYPFANVYGWTESMGEDAITKRNSDAAEASRMLDQLGQSKIDSVDEPVTNSIPTSVKKRIKANAEEKWGTKYNMVDYEIELQEAAFLKYMELRKTTSPLMKTIIANALSKWGDKYSMVVYEIELQSEAKRRLDSRK